MPATSLAEAVRQFFAPSGPLSRAMPAYEQRPAQVDFATAVAEALAAGTPLLAEAGTGIGKTLGYLVPAVLSSHKTLVSTATRALQAQILREDLPTLERALGASLDVVTLKGRRNYLCERRADAWLLGGSLEADERRAQQALRAWRRRTDTGDRSEWAEAEGGGHDDATLWQRLSVGGDECLGRRCAYYESCWLVLARRRAETAAVTITNHHLYFADASLQRRGAGEGEAPVSLLPQVARTVFDEAHELEEIAATHFGAQTSFKQLSELLRSVGDAALEARDGRVHGMAGQALASLTATFEHLDAAGEAPLSAAESCERLRLLSEHLAEGRGALAASQDAKFLSRRLGHAASGAEVAFGVGAPADGAEMVRSVERREGQPVAVARPVDVSAPLSSSLSRVPSVFVSATLQTGGDFSHCQARLGLTDAATCCIDSPFDWAGQATLYVAQHLPPPTVPSAFEGPAAQVAADLICASGGGAFVLCTTSRATASMARAIAARFDGTVLVQGADGAAGREALLQKFAADGNAVLVATGTFWRGVDVKGPALRLVVIDRIPFAPPDDPYLRAQSDAARARGEDGFRRVQLPRAALLLRQGAGRLLRSQQDRGMVALLDARVSHKGYGRYLLASLPDARRLTTLEDAVSWLEAERSRLVSRTG